MNRQEFGSYIEGELRKRASVAILHMKKLDPVPGQQSLVAFTFTANVEGQSQEPRNDFYYFRVDCVFDHVEFDWSDPVTAKARLNDVIDVRWTSMMISLWEAVQGHSGNTYRNERVLDEEEFLEPPAVATNRE